MPSSPSLLLARCLLNDFIALRVELVPQGKRYVVRVVVDRLPKGAKSWTETGLYALPKPEALRALAAELLRAAKIGSELES